MNNKKKNKMVTGLSMVLILQHNASKTHTDYNVTARQINVLLSLMMRTSRFRTFYVLFFSFNSTQLYQRESQRYFHPGLSLSSQLVFNVPFQHKYMAISGKKGQGWRAIPTQYRKASDILTSTLAAFLFSSHPKWKGSLAVRRRLD